MFRLAGPLGFALLLCGCGTDYVSAYEEGVYDYEPIYCYKTLARPMCYDRPLANEGGRLVNYYGPHPVRYPLPPPAPPPSLFGPPEVPCYVRDRDPVGRLPGGTVEVCQMVP